MSEFRLLNEGGVDSRLPFFLAQLRLKARNFHTHLVVSTTSASLRLPTFLSPKRQAEIMFDTNKQLFPLPSAVQISTQVTTEDDLFPLYAA